MKTQLLGIVSTPTSTIFPTSPTILANVAAYQRRKATDPKVVAATAKKWEKPNRPFTGLATVADELRRKCADAAYVASNGRLPNGKFASRRQAKQDADKLSALGFGGK